MTTSARRSVLVILAAAVGLLVQPAAANACSCIRPDLERDLPMADGAIVGTIEGRTDPGADVRSSIRVRVEHVAKGDIDQDVVEVWSSGSSASCGLNDMPSGQRIGLLLQHVDEGSWSSGLCQLVDADELASIDPPADEDGRSLLSRIVAWLRTLCMGASDVA